MIQKIVMNKVASYRGPTEFETDKRVNLIYGLNGAGKSTLSTFLYNPKDPKFMHCAMHGVTNEEILVYNQNFIRDYFHEADSLKGIFTLSKENKKAKNEVREAEKELQRLENERLIQIQKLQDNADSIDQRKTIAENNIWAIKTEYTGGDRVFEYCLEGLKGQKEKLFNFLVTQAKPVVKPTTTIDQLKDELLSLKDANAQKSPLLPVADILASEIETDPIFKKVILGNNDSIVAALIDKLENSDWVKDGLAYVQPHEHADGFSCPFCQQTINASLVEKLQSYFDKTYEADLQSIKEKLNQYGELIASLPDKNALLAHPFISATKDEFNDAFGKLLKVLEDNLKKISEKQKSPSKSILLTDSETSRNEFQSYLARINQEISKHNLRIDNKEGEFLRIKDKFWKLMRWTYDQTIASFQADEANYNKKISELNAGLVEIDKKLTAQKKRIVSAQAQTVNIQEAIANINSGLLDLGIDGFSIMKYSDALYQIQRQGGGGNTFQSLSEGEKMIISFLYFVELCKGKVDAASTIINKIIVIDDPISSLSHIYVFNIGQLIKRNFTNPASKYSQVIILTHSLYFFYELTFTKKDDRDKYQKLFRVSKKAQGSQIDVMHYQDVQNDYQTYWQIVKDESEYPALIANCMRNIIEYFFSFIEKIELNNVFAKPVLQADKYQAFCRYMNRESHSLGQNIFDIKEFNYDEFKEAFRLVFKESGYETHYQRMIA